MTLIIQNDQYKNWDFQNQLPSPLQKNISREWGHKIFGEPDNAVAPKVLAMITFGWVERFTIDDFSIPVTMRIGYDLREMVKDVTFLPTSELRW